MLRATMAATLLVFCAIWTLCASSSHLENFEYISVRIKGGESLGFRKLAHFDMSVQPLSDEPMRQLGHLLASCFPYFHDSFNSPGFAEFYTKNQYDTVVIYFDDHGHPVAHANVSLTELANGFKYEYLHALCVAEHLRNKGLGRKFLKDAVETHMKHYQIDFDDAWIGLNVHQNHAQSLSFYKRLGFSRGWILNTGGILNRFLNDNLPHEDMPHNEPFDKYSVWPLFFSNNEYPYLSMFKKYTDYWGVKSEKHRIEYIINHE